jgi:Bacterial low temperature requirement A protein (LtrA)
VSDLAEADSRAPQLLRDRSGVQRVTNIELFFDLVYVFAITQLSHYLLGHADLRGALQAGLLLMMVWLVWSYTTWVTNWLYARRFAQASWSGGAVRPALASEPSGAAGSHVALSAISCTPSAR